MEMKQDGRSKTRIYKVWYGIISRTTCKTDTNYKRYGAKGIGICDRWLSFYNFLEDMGDPKEKLVLDRINGNLGYFKENCRWVTQKQNSNNRVTNQRTVEYKGRKMTLSEFSDLVKIPYKIVYARLGYGWDVERIATTERMKNQHSYAVASWSSDNEDKTLS
jgi:hypothetical protein